MSAFYNRLIKTATRLITKYGTPTVFRSLVSVPNPNPAKPATVTPVEHTYDAVFTKIDLKEIDGVRVLTGDQRVLVRGNIDPDFKINGSIVDPVDASIWKVIDVQKVAPGPSIILFKVQVRK